MLKRALIVNVSEEYLFYTMYTNMHTEDRRLAIANRRFWPWLLAMAAVLAVGFGATDSGNSYLSRIAKERELIAAGNTIVSAIKDFRDHSPGTAKQYPQSLDDLTFDRRFLQEKKYLDYIPVDPITLKAQWGLVRDSDGAIIGVHSLSDAAPTWIGRWLGPSGSGNERYSDWKFVHSP